MGPAVKPAAISVAPLSKKPPPWSPRRAVLSPRARPTFSSLLGPLLRLPSDLQLQHVLPRKPDAQAGFGNRDAADGGTRGKTRRLRRKRGRMPAYLRDDLPGVQLQANKQLQEAKLGVRMIICGSNAERFKRKRRRQKKRKAKKDTAKMVIIKPREAAPLRKVEVAVGPVKVAAARRELVQQLYPHAQALWQARKHQMVEWGAGQTPMLPTINAPRATSPSTAAPAGLGMSGIGTSCPSVTAAAAAAALPPPPAAVPRPPPTPAPPSRQFGRSSAARHLVLRVEQVALGMSSRQGQAEEPVLQPAGTAEKEEQQAAPPCASPRILTPRAPKTPRGVKGPRPWMMKWAQSRTLSEKTTTTVKGRLDISISKTAWREEVAEMRRAALIEELERREQARLVSQTLRPRQELWLAVVAAATRLEHWAALFRRRRTFVDLSRLHARAVGRRLTYEECMSFVQMRIKVWLARRREARMKAAAKVVRRALFRFRLRMLIITKRRAVKLLYRFIIDRMLNPTSRLRTYAYQLRRRQKAFARLVKGYLVCMRARRRALAMLWHRKETELALLIRQTQAKRVVTDGIHLEKGPRTAAIKQFLRQQLAACRSQFSVLEAHKEPICLRQAREFITTGAVPIQVDSTTSGTSFLQHMLRQKQRRKSGKRGTSVVPIMYILAGQPGPETAFASCVLRAHKMYQAGKVAQENYIKSIYGVRHGERLLKSFGASHCLGPLAAQQPHIG